MAFQASSDDAHCPTSYGVAFEEAKVFTHLIKLPLEAQNTLGWHEPGDITNAIRKPKGTTIE